ncbi:MAG TPA: tyrosine-type recombinase/integrase [Candidatus Deferrimicrobiaceae bacterium]
MADKRGTSPRFPGSPSRIARRKRNRFPPPTIPPARNLFPCLGPACSPRNSYSEPSGRNFFLSVEEAGALLAACHSHHRPVVLCALETGMRKAEIFGLRWSDIRNGMVYLPGDRTKNGKPREIPVSNRLAEELKRLRRRQAER